MSSPEDECKRIIGLKDYYEILGVPKTASEEQIKKAYKKLAIKFHPDKNKCKGAEDAFKQVNQAFSVLGNKDKKAHYDMFGTEEGVGMQGQYADVDPFEMFNIFFQNSGFGPMGGGFPRGGRTKVTFSNGGTTYSFSSFGGGDDDDDIFNQFFSFGPGMGARSSSRRGGRESQEDRERRNKEKERRQQMQRNIENMTTCLQLCPLICCLVFVIFPFMMRLI